MWWESDAAGGRLEQVLREINSGRLAGTTHALAGPQRDLVDFADTRLAAYGTLRPGESNYGQLATVPGHWLEGVVDGVRFEARGYPAFAWQPGHGHVAVSVLTSAALPAHWARLDEFEGPDYCRILVPVRLTNARILVANLYAYIGPLAPD